MNNSQVKIVYKKPTNYDNMTTISSDNNSINDSSINDRESYKNDDIILENIELNSTKTKKDVNYLEKFDNILTTIDINDGLFVGILLLVFITIIIIFYKKI